MTTKILFAPLRFIRHRGLISQPCLRDQSKFLCTTTPLLQNPKLKSQSTVDQSEVDKHTNLMDSWWDVKGPMKALHSFNILRVPFIRDGLISYPPREKTLTPLCGFKILDVGCGGGILSEALARLGAEVTGVDASDKLIEMAQSHCNKDPRLTNNKPTYYCTPIEDHAPKYEKYYDGVVASEIIEHIDNNNKELFIKSCLHTLKPGGKIFFTTPCRTNLSKLLVIGAAECVLRIVPRGTHDFEKFTTPNELTFLLERNGCQVEMVFGLFYEYFTNKWSFTKSQSLMFALQAVKLEDC